MSQFDPMIDEHDQPEQGGDARKVFIPLDEGDAAGGAAMGTTSAFGGRRYSGGGLGGLLGGPVVAVLMIVLGGGAIYGMRMVSRAPALSTEGVSIEFTSILTGQEFAKRFDKAMDGMERSNKPVQVDRGFVQRTPFSYPKAMTNSPDEIVEDGSLRQRELAERARLIKAEKERKQREEEQQIIDDALTRVLLQGVVGGRVPLARISGKTLRLGDTVGDIFTVVEFENGQTVVIEALGRRFRLSIASQPVELD